MLDFSNIKIKGEKRGLDSAMVSIERVPVSKSILVSGLSDNTTHDAIQLHFESRRNNGGPVKKIQFGPGRDRAVVVFEDEGGSSLFSNYTVCQGSVLLRQSGVHCLFSKCRLSSIHNKSYGHAVSSQTFSFLSPFFFKASTKMKLKSLSLLKKQKNKKGCPFCLVLEGKHYLGLHSFSWK